MTALTYTSKPLPGQCWAVIDSTGKTWAVCDRPQDAERVAYCMTVVAQSEETDERAAS